MEGNETLRGKKKISCPLLHTATPGFTFLFNCCQHTLLSATPSCNARPSCPCWAHYNDKGPVGNRPNPFPQTGSVPSAVFPSAPCWDIWRRLRYERLWPEICLLEFFFFLPISRISGCRTLDAIRLFFQSVARQNSMHSRSFPGTEWHLSVWTRAQGLATSHHQVRAWQREERRGRLLASWLDFH